MKISKCKYRIRCELGACGRRADYTVLPERTGVRSCLHICSECLRELGGLAERIAGGEVRE